MDTPQRLIVAGALALAVATAGCGDPAVSDRTRFLILAGQGGVAAHRTMQAADQLIDHTSCEKAFWAWLKQAVPSDTTWLAWRGEAEQMFVDACRTGRATPTTKAST